MPEQTPTTYAAGVPDAKTDPTSNVRELVDAANLRQDDLREAEVRYNDLRAEHSKEIADLRERHQRELDEKESSRLDSIRQVDREEVNKSAITAQTAITTLANQTIALKDTLQMNVTNTAATLENRQAESFREVNKRVSDLENKYSEGKGKSEVIDPQMTALLSEMRLVRESLSEKHGSGAGMERLAGWLVAGIVAAIAVATYLNR